MHALSNFQKSIPAPASKQRPASNHDYLCSASNCYSTCSPQPPLVSVWVSNMVPWFQLGQRSKSAHPYPRHCQTRGQRDLGSVGSNIVEKPPRFVENPADPSPSVGPSIRVEEAVQPQKQGDAETEEKLVSQYQPGRMRGVLEQKLHLLRKAKERLWQGIMKVKRIFSVRIRKH